MSNLIHEGHNSTPLKEQEFVKLQGNEDFIYIYIYGLLNFEEFMQLYIYIYIYILEFMVHGFHSIAA